MADFGSIPINGTSAKLQELLDKDIVDVVSEESTDEQLPTAKAVNELFAKNSGTINSLDSDLNANRHNITNISKATFSKKQDVEGEDVYSVFELSCGSTQSGNAFASFSDNVSGMPIRLSGVADGTSDNDAATCGQLWDLDSKSEHIANRVTFVDETSDDEHYPTAKAVKDYLGSNGGSGGHCWQGKKVVFLGDSIAQGYTDKGNVATPYPKVVADNLGMTLTNYGIGGSTVAQQENYGGAFATQEEFEATEKDTSKIYQVITGQGKKTYEYDSDTSAWVNSSVNARTPLSARWSFMRDDADLIVVQSGTNDFQYDWTPVGTMADRTPYTFYGALHTLFAGLIEKYKGKTIVFLTSLKRAQTPYTTPESQNSYGKTLSDYRDMMLEVCDYYGVPVIDVFSVSGLNPYLASQADLFDNAKTHPLQWGHYRLGDIVASRLLCVQRFSSAEYEPPVEPDVPDEPTAVVWYENKALESGHTALKDMNYRTTCDFVAIPESGLTITLTDDDIEMCVYTYTVNKTQAAGTSSYLTERTYSAPYNEVNTRYVRVMIRSKSQPNAKIITSAMATAGVHFTAS